MVGGQSQCGRVAGCPYWVGRCPVLSAPAVAPSFCPCLPPFTRSLPLFASPVPWPVLPALAPLWPSHPSPLSATLSPLQLNFLQQHALATSISFGPSALADSLAVLNCPAFAERNGGLLQQLQNLELSSSLDLSPYSGG